MGSAVPSRVSQLILHTEAEPGAYSRDSSPFSRRRPFIYFFRQQKGTTAKSTDWREDYPIQADFAENMNAVTAARVAAREEAAIGKQWQGTASTDENKQYDPGGTGGDPLIST